MNQRKAHAKPPQPEARRASLRRWLYELLEPSPFDDWTAVFVNRAIMALVLVNLIAVVLQSEPDLDARYGGWFFGLELISLVVFTLEYAARFWVADEHPAYRGLSPWRAGMRYARSPEGLIDLVAVLPFWLAFAFPTDLRVLLVLRVVRFLKLARYSPAMRSLLDALYAERRALFGCFVILLGTALIAASVMHLVERQAQPDKFGTVGESLWWAIVTLGTIGYGDAIPITAAGRVVASLTIFSGLIMIALPVGIVATAFASEVHRRDFVVTWRMVAQVPLFAGLTATEIADIMRLLSAQTFEPGDVIVRRGEPAQSMYFIAGGEVEIALAREKVRLSAGHFFGEIAVLRRAHRSATVTAVVRTNLLVLKSGDLHALMERDPRLSERVRAIARERVGADAVEPRGDLTTEEIEPGHDNPE